MQILTDVVIETEESATELYDWDQHVHFLRISGDSKHTLIALHDDPNL
jgi:hypothetical protein